MSLHKPEIRRDPPPITFILSLSPALEQTPSLLFSFLLFYIIYTFILSYYLRKSENQESKMASRFGFQSTTMIVTNTPAADLALTNLAYCSPSDLHNFAVPGTKLFLALVADSSVLSFSYPWIYGIVFLIN